MNEIKQDAPLQVYKPCLLQADSSETSIGTVVDVYRTVLLTDDRPMYAPVAEFIERNGLSLIHREEHDDDGMMFARAERLVYAQQPAEVR